MSLRFNHDQELKDLSDSYKTLMVARSAVMGVFKVQIEGVEFPTLTPEQRSAAPQAEKDLAQCQQNLDLARAHVLTWSNDIEPQLTILPQAFINVNAFVQAWEKEVNSLSADQVGQTLTATAERLRAEAGKLSALQTSTADLSSQLASDAGNFSDSSDSFSGLMALESSSLSDLRAAMRKISALIEKQNQQIEIDLTSANEQLDMARAVIELGDDDKKEDKKDGTGKKDDDDKAGGKTGDGIAKAASGLLDKLTALAKGDKKPSADDDKGDGGKDGGGKDGGGKVGGGKDGGGKDGGGKDGGGKDGGGKGVDLQQLANMAKVTIGVVLIAIAEGKIDDAIKAIHDRLDNAQQQAQYQMTVSALSLQLVSLESARSVLATMAANAKAVTKILDSAATWFNDRAADLEQIAATSSPGSEMDEVSLKSYARSWATLALAGRNWQAMSAGFAKGATDFSVSVRGFDPALAANG